MTRHTMWTVCALALGACGGSQGGATTPELGNSEPATTTDSTPAPAPAAFDWDGLLGRCGVDVTGDPADTPPRDLEACRSYMIEAFKLEHGEAAILVNGDAIAESMCMNGYGEGCRFRALWAQLGIWNGDATYDAESVTWYLHEGCNHGDQESCSILLTGSDSAGRQWAIDPNM